MKKKDDWPKASWQSKTKYSVIASYLAMYIGFLGIILSILYMLITTY